MNFMAVKNKKKEKIAGLVIYSYNKNTVHLQQLIGIQLSM